MISLVAPKDFAKGRYRIPNAISMNAGEGINADLQDVINSSVYDLLYEALGQTQYDELDAIEDLSAAPQKWKDFVNGNGSYRGIKEILMPFVFCNWLQYDNVHYSTVGGSKPDTVGGSTASLAGKYVRAWNTFVESYQENATGQWSGGSNKDSLYEFMTAFPENWDVSHFRLFEYENRFMS